MHDNIGATAPDYSSSMWHLNRAETIGKDYEQRN